MLAQIPAGIAQAHRVAAGESAVESNTQFSGIGKTVVALMTGGAGDGLVQGEASIVEKNATQRGAEVSRDICSRHVVLAQDGLNIKRRRELRGGVVEGKRREMQCG